MKEQFVSYDIALKLKELGFNKPCLAMYNSDKDLKHVLDWEHCNSQEKCEYIFGIGFIQAPLWQQVIDWLEREYDILFGFLPKIGSEYSHWGQECSEIHTYIHGSLVYSPKYRCYDIFFWKDGKFNGSAHGYGNLYNCREYAILTALESCKEKNLSQH